MSTTDTKVFRLSAEMQNEVDPVILQQALEKTYAQYMLYHSVLRRGIFWYYLQYSDIKPQVTRDVLPPCSQLYHFDQSELLFRVIYNHHRVHLEVFHVLSDGTGALWFFEDLLKEYILLRHPEALEDITNEQRQIEQRHLEDSFVTYFRQGEQQNFTESAQSALRKFAKSSKRAAFEYGRKAKRFVWTTKRKKRQKRKVHRIVGKKTADNRTKVIELEMPVREVLNLAHEQDATLTMYLIALYFEAIREASPTFQTGETIAISVPVNLRQFYPSNSERNFFSTVKLKYTYPQEKEVDVKKICDTLTKQMQHQLTKENLEKRLSRLISFEYNPFNRLVPRPIKDGILKIVNYFNNRNLTVAMSNLGRVSFPTFLESYVDTLYFHTSAVRPQFCVISHGDKLSISFTSPYLETAIQESFVRKLTQAGVEVTVAANKVTTSELRGEEE
ncbi:alcohol acetyltransferase [Desemzia sp. RIT804]|nr:alcohol acetyltransferase [Desemzia sp. RIT 804]